MYIYQLTRDDGVDLRIAGSVWEAALELAYLYGWRPAGTEAPRTDAWRGRRSASRARVWDGQDYFSHESQRVTQDDARALGDAILRALPYIPEPGVAPRESPHVAAVPGCVVPSRASAMADGLSGVGRRAMRRFAAFSGRGGFRIGGDRATAPSTDVDASGADGRRAR